MRMVRNRTHGSQLNHLTILSRVIEITNKRLPLMKIQSHNRRAAVYLQTRSKATEWRAWVMDRWIHKGQNQHVCLMALQTKMEHRRQLRLLRCRTTRRLLPSCPEAVSNSWMATHHPRNQRILHRSLDSNNRNSTSWMHHRRRWNKVEQTTWWTTTTNTQIYKTHKHSFRRGICSTTPLCRQSRQTLVIYR